MKNLAFACLAAIFLSVAGIMPAAAAEVVLLEAEQFDDPGGWVMDQQSMDQMGSPYLLAHGLGEAVRDATTTATFPVAGRYHVWVRTRDWVAPWKVPGTPGRFQVLVDGKSLATIFGTEGAAWHWQDGGLLDVGRKVRVALHDLTGLEGRCDAVLFCRDPAFQPPNELTALAKFRRHALGLPEEPQDGGHYDLVVVGGGIAGSCAALSAARLGLTVALVQDRPVLGGNGSSEVRVWPEGWTNQKPYPRIGDIVGELLSNKPRPGNKLHGPAFGDEQKRLLVAEEPRIHLFLDHHVNGVETRGVAIRAVIAQDIGTSRRFRLGGRWFADCTGDATLGCLAGADNEISPQHMGATNMWRVKDAGSAQSFPQCLCKDDAPLDMGTVEGKEAAPFPRCPWAVDLHDKPFPGRKGAVGQWAGKGLSSLGGWFWESGYDRDPISDVEWIRDLNLRAMYGAWDTLKNVDHLYPNHKLGWAAYIAGKRESRRLLGDVILTADDFRTQHAFPDACFPCSWSIDVHVPHATFTKEQPGNEFIGKSTAGQPHYTYHGPYWAPYRCLYSRNLTNLFMAGRDISVTHEGLGPVRVMRTCGMMGEVVGMAAFLCREHDCTPRAVYQKQLAELKQLMTRGCGKHDLAVASK